MPPRLQRSIDSLRRWAAALLRDAHALWLAARDPRTPVLARLLAALVAAYALSPIDLIPDVIPVLGWLDDLLLVPAGLWLARRLIPPALLAEFRARAQQAQRPVTRRAVALVAATWVVLTLAAAWLVIR